MKIDFKPILEKLQQAAIEAAVKIAAEYAVPATKDAAAFVAASAENLARYASLYSEGQITAPELDNLVKGQAALANMEALTTLGLAQVEIQKTRDAIINAVTSALTGAIKGLTP